MTFDPTATPIGVEEARRSGRLILVAEDDEVNRNVILRQLELLGYAADVAANGSEALELWRTRPYAMVLTDLQMPVMDGYQLAEAIRKAEAPGVHIPIAALTANALSGEEVRARDLGMDDFLIKPIRLRDLKESIERMLPDTAKPATAVSDGRPASAPSVPLDLTVLTALVGEDPEFITQLLGDFRERALVAQEELRAAVTAADFDAAARTMHRIKSAARSIGALPLGEDCATAEAAAKRTDLDALRQAATTFEKALAVVLAELDRVR